MAIPVARIDTNVLKQALNNLLFRVGATPRVLYCDRFSTHVANKTIGLTRVEPHPSHSHHRVYAETRVGTFKKYLRSISATSKGEKNALGSLCLWDIAYVLDMISKKEMTDFMIRNVMTGYACNSTPIGPYSSLSPAQIIHPGVLNALMRKNFEEESFIDLGTLKNARTVDRLLAKYREIIFTERSKNLLKMQEEHEARDRVHKVKKGQRTSATAQVGDVCLVDMEDGKKLRLARIMAINDAGTTAEVLINGKLIKQAVCTLRVLSVYREPAQTPV